jgi:hypothetical protein
MPRGVAPGSVVLIYFHSPPKAMNLQSMNRPRIVEITFDFPQPFSDSQAECRGFDSHRLLHTQLVCDTCVSNCVSNSCSVHVPVPWLNQVGMPPSSARFCCKEQPSLRAGKRPAANCDVMVDAHSWPGRQAAKAVMRAIPGRADPGKVAPYGTERDVNALLVPKLLGLTRVQEFYGGFLDRFLAMQERNLFGEN